MFCKIVVHKFKNELSFKTFPRADIGQVIWSRNTTTATELLLCVCLMHMSVWVSVCVNIHPRRLPKVLTDITQAYHRKHVSSHLLESFLSLEVHIRLSLTKKPCSFRFKRKVPVKCQYSHKYKPPETLDIQKGNVLILCFHELWKQPKSAGELLQLYIQYYVTGRSIIN